MYLGAELSNMTNVEGQECWDLSYKNYCTEAGTNVESVLEKHGLRLPPKCVTLRICGYCPQMDFNGDIKLDVFLLKGRKQSYGQNRLLIIYDDKWSEPGYVASQLFCTYVGTIPLYGKMCVHRTLRGEVLVHPRSRCGVTLRCRYLGEFSMFRYVSRIF